MCEVSKESVGRPETHRPAQTESERYKQVLQCGGSEHRVRQRPLPPIVQVQADHEHTTIPEHAENDNFEGD